MGHQDRFIKQLAASLTEDPDIYTKRLKKLSEALEDPRSEQEPGEVRAYDATPPEEAGLKPIEPDLDQKAEEDKGHIGSLLAPIIGSKYFGEGGVTHANLEPGSESGRLLVVTSDDRQGPDLVVKLLRQYCRKLGFRCLVASGQDGADAVRASESALEAAQKTPGKHIVVLDEPSKGLPDSYKQALGQRIISRYKSLSANTMLVMVITHSRALIEELMPLSPGHLRLGDNFGLKDIAGGKVPPKTDIDLSNFADPSAL